jgi:hypothetical protein
LRRLLPRSLQPGIHAPCGREQVSLSSAAFGLCPPTRADGSDGW